MGTYTAALKFYKPAGSEFVDAEVQLNRNWDITDPAVRRLLEYEYTNVNVPNVTGSVNRARFFKIYSNSVVAWFSQGNFFWQDPLAFVTPFTAFDVGPDEVEHPDYPVAFRIIKKSGGTTSQVEWTGAFWQGGTAMDLNTNIVLVPAGSIPVAARPAVTKYFTVWAGNTTADFSIARILIGSDGRIEWKRYGVNTPAGNESRIEMTGIMYNVEVAP